jgi:ubiquinone/menaquinone biosynthesis C-methylase UbiE
MLNRSFIARHRRERLASAQGEILEIGFGTGLNLACYPEHVRKITTVDPNEGMNNFARQRIEQSGIDVHRHLLSSEHLPFEADTFDCVVCTFTLCSIHHVARAIAEVQRVLKPNGVFLFLEHGLSCEPGIQKWQRRLNWLEMRLGDGCRLDRNMKMLVRESFPSLEVAEFYLERTPKTHGYLYRGCAQK